MHPGPCRIRTELQAREAWEASKGNGLHRAPTVVTPVAVTAAAASVAQRELAAKAALMVEWKGNRLRRVPMAVTTVASLGALMVAELEHSQAETAVMLVGQADKGRHHSGSKIPTKSSSSNECIPRNTNGI